MGTRLIFVSPRALGEDVAPMSMLDGLDRMEQIGWIPSAAEWADLRRIRNEFTHEYPGSTQVRLERFQLARSSAQRSLKILGGLDDQVPRRFPESGA